jgi:hypothetical protein
MRIAAEDAVDGGRRLVYDCRVSSPLPASIKRTNFWVLPIVWWRISTPLDLADASMRLVTAIDQLPKDGFLVHERIYGGVSFGTIRFGLTQLDTRSLLWRNEPHNPASHDGQVLMRGSVKELANGGSQVSMVLFPATFISFFLLCVLGGCGFTLLRHADPLSGISGAAVWFFVQLRVQMIARRLNRLLHHAYGVG